MRSCLGLKTHAGNFGLRNANQMNLSNSLGSGAALSNSSASVWESELRARLMTAREVALIQDPENTY